METKTLRIVMKKKQQASNYLFKTQLSSRSTGTIRFRLSILFSQLPLFNRIKAFLILMK